MYHVADSFSDEEPPLLLTFKIRVLSLTSNIEDAKIDNLLLALLPTLCGLVIALQYELTSLSLFYLQAAASWRRCTTRRAS